jgi:signal transduction histidine kinase
VDEPWPPRRGPYEWRRVRARIARRVAVIFGLLLALSATGAVGLFSLVFGRRGLNEPPGSWPSIAVVGLLALLSLVMLLVALMRRIGLPLSDVVAAADHVARGDYAVRLAENGPPPLRSVARAFNSMAAQLERQDAQRRHLMADIAHELRTPLSIVQGRLEGLLDGVYARDDATLGEVLEDTRLLARLVEDLRTLADAESGALALRKEPTDLGALIHDAAAALASTASARGVKISVEEHGTLAPVDLDPLRIREVLTNLLSNALNHCSPGASVVVAARALRDRVEVSVRDTGSGIPPEALPHIFDRFYKDAASHGSGLGLTIARNLVAAHGGEIRAESKVGEGTTITFGLPAHGAKS